MQEGKVKLETSKETKKPDPVRPPIKADSDIQLSSQDMS
jgi:hypothetical protein